MKMTPLHWQVLYALAEHPDTRVLVGTAEVFIHDPSCPLDAPRLAPALFHNLAAAGLVAPDAPLVPTDAAPHLVAYRLTPAGRAEADKCRPRADEAGAWALSSGRGKALHWWTQGRCSPARRYPTWTFPVWRSRCGLRTFHQPVAGRSSCYGGVYCPRCLAAIAGHHDEPPGDPERR